MVVEGPNPLVVDFLCLQQLLMGNKMNIFTDKLKQLLAMAKFKKKH